jgi:hypothetical protein
MVNPMLLKSFPIGYASPRANTGRKDQVGVRLEENRNNKEVGTEMHQEKKSQELLD